MEKDKNVFKIVDEPPFIQRRLRHLRQVVARNVHVSDVDLSDSIGLFFTLHLTEESSAIYNSETLLYSQNPNWRCFSSDQFPDNVNLSSSGLIVRLLCTSRLGIKLVSEWIVSFSGLISVGKQLPMTSSFSNANSLYFCMGESAIYYGASTPVQRPKMWETKRIPLKRIKESEGEKEKESVSSLSSTITKSYSLNSLTRCRVVHRAIRQEQAALKRVKNLVNDRLLATTESNRHECKDISEWRMRVALLREELAREKRELVDAKVLLDKKESANQESGCDLMEEYRDLKKSRERLVENGRSYIDTREQLLKTNAQLFLRRKQLISDLTVIYPIKEYSDKRFAIAGVPLPNAEDYTGADDCQLSVALAHAAHLVCLIAHLLDVPLRYPIKWAGCRLMIVDHVTPQLQDRDRDFPLFVKGRDRVQFNYATFLLNKNIAQLRFYCGLATQDLRATLPNLLNLLELKLGVKRDQYAIIKRSSRQQIKDMGEVPISPLVRTSSSPPCSNASMESIANKPTPFAVANGLSEDQCRSSDGVTVNKLLMAAALSGGLSGSLDQGLNKINAAEPKEISTAFATDGEWEQTESDDVVTRKHRLLSREARTTARIEQLIAYNSSTNNLLETESDSSVERNTSDSPVTDVTKRICDDITPDCNYTRSTAEINFVIVLEEERVGDVTFVNVEDVSTVNDHFKDSISVDVKCIADGRNDLGTVSIANSIQVAGNEIGGKVVKSLISSSDSEHKFLKDKDDSRRLSADENELVRPLAELENGLENGCAVLEITADEELALASLLVQTEELATRSSSFAFGRFRTNSGSDRK